MKFKLLFSFLLFLLVNSSFAQFTFQKVISTGINATGKAIQQTPDSGYIIAGYSQTAGSNYNDVYLVRTNSEGDTLWTRTYGGSNDDQGYSVDQTSDGGYIVAGNTKSFVSGGGLYLVKTKANGDTLWTKAYSGITNSTGQCYVKQTSDGGYILVGSTVTNGTLKGDIYLVKTDGTGNITWARAYGGNNTETGACVRQTADHGYIVCGSTASFGAGGDDIYLIKTNSGGDTLWTKTYGGSSNDDAATVEVTGDGGFIITGSTMSFGQGISDVYLIKTNSNGDTLWTRTYGGASFDVGVSGSQTADGGYIIAGNTNTFTVGFNNVYLIKTNSTGDTLWTKSYGGSGFDYGYDVTKTKDGACIVVGGTNSFAPAGNAAGVYLIKTGVNGNTGCHQIGTTTVAAPSPALVAATHATVSTGGTASATATMVGHAGKDNTICSSVGFNEFSMDKNVSFYPNPVQNQFTVYGLQFAHNVTIDIYNMLGEKIYSRIVRNPLFATAVDASSFSQGVYLLKVSTDSESGVWKFIKE